MNFGTMLASNIAMVRLIGFWSFWLIVLGAVSIAIRRWTWLIPWLVVVCIAAIAFTSCTESEPTPCKGAALEGQWKRGEDDSVLLATDNCKIVDFQESVPRFGVYSYSANAAGVLYLNSDPCTYARGYETLEIQCLHGTAIHLSRMH